MMKVDVSYKNPKKMKKRRQLDALVDTVKLPRSRKNASTQELLDYHSDSSEVEEFSAGSLSSRKKCCVCHSVVARLGLFIVSMACLATCVGLVWVQLHVRHELDTLRKEVHAVQNDDKTPPEMIKFQSQLAAINGSINRLKVESIPGIRKDITLMKHELEMLKDETSKLSKSVEAAVNLLDIPKKLEALQNTVATATNDLDELKGKVEKLMNPKTPAPTTTSPKPLDNVFVSQFEDELLTLNQSVQAKLLSVNKLLEQQAMKISVLESSHVPSSADGSNNGSLEVFVRGVVQDMLSNQSMSLSGNTSLAVSQTQMDALQRQVDDIIEDVKQIETQRNRNHVSYGEYNAFKEDTVSTFEDVNSTLLTLNLELNTMSTRINLVAQNVAKMAGALVEDNSTTTEPVASGPSSDVTWTQTSTSKLSSLQTSTNATSEVETDNESTDFQPMELKDVHLMEDLDKAMNSWPLQEEKVNITTLNGVLQTPLSPTDMELYDTDHDGLYTKDEMAAALHLEEPSR